ncbi:MAG: hypothetical protein E7261_11500 [Lachnospiraceae bacterium]|nr:hypothetical protein [Lachnospiraceae bacterium]
MKKLRVITQHFNKRNIIMALALVALVVVFMKYDLVTAMDIIGEPDYNSPVDEDVNRYEPDGDEYYDNDSLGVFLIEYDEAQIENFIVANVAEATDSSHLVTSKGNEYPVANCLDNDLSTMWQDGEDGYGEGSELKFSFDDDVRLRCIRIFGGSGKSEKKYFENGRVRDITVVIDDLACPVVLEDYNGYQLIWLDGDVYCDDVAITVNSVYTGSEYEDTCISEITFFAE